MSDTDPFKNPSSGSLNGAELPPTEPMPTTPAPYGAAPAPSWAPQADAAAQQPQYTQNSYGTADASQASAGDNGYAPPAYAAQPPYAAPAGSQAYGQNTSGASRPAGFDGVSIAALVTGLLGFAFVAIVLGAVGMRRTAQAVRKGTWMAVTGLVLGIIATIAWTAVITGVIVASLDVADGIQQSIEDGTVDGWDYDVNYDAQNYGDDPELDALYDQCGAGDDAACDDLYWASTYGSEYEQFASDCGGRGMPTGQLYCNPDDQW